MPDYRGPDHTRNALILLRALAEGDGEGPAGMLLSAQELMAIKNGELGLAAQDEVGKRARETLLEAIRLALFFAAKYAGATGRTVMDVIDETQVMFEASIPDGMDPRPTQGNDG